jgi:hypothetical protein
VPVIIWINGGFGAGKTTLAQELGRRLPDAVVYNPEDVGLMLWKWIRPNGDFQHLPSWRELVVATALSLRRHHADTLIVPMSLVRGAYRAEILGGLADAGEEVLHVFLEADAGVLRERLNARVTHPGKDWDQVALEFGMTGVDEMVAAADRQPRGTLMLRSDRLTPAELAEEVLARAGLHQVHGNDKPMRQAGPLNPGDALGVAAGERPGSGRERRNRVGAQQAERYRGRQRGRDGPDGGQRQRRYLLGQEPHHVILGRGAQWGDQ